MYTHRITYTRNIRHIGEVSCSFRTVADAVDLHMAALAKQGDVSMIVVELL